MSSSSMVAAYKVGQLFARLRWELQHGCLFGREQDVRSAEQTVTAIAMAARDLVEDAQKQDLQDALIHTWEVNRPDYASPNHWDNLVTASHEIDQFDRFGDLYGPVATAREALCKPFVDGVETIVARLHAELHNKIAVRDGLALRLGERTAEALYPKAAYRHMYQRPVPPSIEWPSQERSILTGIGEHSNDTHEDDYKPDIVNTRLEPGQIRPADEWPSELRQRWRELDIEHAFPVIKPWPRDEWNPALGRQLVADLQQAFLTATNDIMIPAPWNRMRVELDPQGSSYIILDGQRLEAPHDAALWILRLWEARGEKRSVRQLSIKDADLDGPQARDLRRKLPRLINRLVKGTTNGCHLDLSSQAQRDL